MTREIAIIIEAGRLTVLDREQEANASNAKLLLTTAVDKRTVEEVAGLVARLVGTAIADAIRDTEGGE